MPKSNLKLKIAQSFGSASSSYDCSARLQRHSGGMLLDLIAQETEQNVAGHHTSQQVVLDLGCGTGYFTDIWANTDAKIFGLDISKSMLQFAQLHRSDKVQWLAGDVHQLPFADNSLDIIFSNLVIQWCDPLDLTFKEIHRVLKPGGKVVFATLLDGTLQELKQSWAVVDDDQHVIDFKTEQDVRQNISDDMFNIEQCNIDSVILPYDNVKHLAVELKSLGANYLPNKQRKGLSGKSAWQKMCSAYLQYKDLLGNYPATYQLFTALLTKKSDT